MPDLLIQDIGDEVMRQIEARASVHLRSLSDEAKSLIRKGLSEREGELKLGTALCSLVAAEDRGDDLVFEVPEPVRPPPDFE
ncbi:MAG TPA: hypothetical protein VF913_09480 [Xanthobacteraceae bacterium]